jgi:hypothetical protein
VSKYFVGTAIVDPDLENDPYFVMFIRTRVLKIFATNMHSLPTDGCNVNIKEMQETRCVVNATDAPTPAAKCHMFNLFQVQSG